MGICSLIADILHNPPLFFFLPRKSETGLSGLFVLFFNPCTYIHMLLKCVANRVDSGLFFCVELISIVKGKCVPVPTIGTLYTRLGSE